MNLQSILTACLPTILVSLFGPFSYAAKFSDVCGNYKPALLTRDFKKSLAELEKLQKIAERTPGLVGLTPLILHNEATLEYVLNNSPQSIELENLALSGSRKDPILSKQNIVIAQGESL